MMKPKLYVFALLAAVLALLVAGCGGDDDEGDEGGGEEVSGTVEIAGVWTGEEAKSFNAVLDGFSEQNPDVDVKYRAVGDEIPTVLSTSVEGGNPPDLAAVPQPGLVEEFVDKGALQPLDFVEDDLNENYNEGAIDIATFDGKVYGFLFKAANKSTIWYNVPLFEQAGVEPPDDFDQFLANAKTLQQSGTKAYSIGVDAGWPMTDLFENIYLRQAGADKYDQLSKHEIPWTDQSVKDALETMAEVVGDSDNIVGGTAQALQTDFPTSVQNAFKEDPEGAQVLEGDFVAGEITASTPAEPGTDFDVFEFPSIDGSEPAVVGGGDTIIMFDDTPASEALVTYLASAEAHEIWAGRGGFSSANTSVGESAYPDEITARTATAIAEADTFRFDMSDLQPAAFGATVGQGMWKDLTDFMANPDDVDGTAAQLEKDAKDAFK
jgi:alpha-glucoside transport system substrate-binding protein